MTTKKICVSITNVRQVQFEEFYDSFKLLRENHSEKDTVLLRKKEYYEDCRCFYVVKHKNKVAGTIAVKKDGEIVSFLTDNEHYYHAGSVLMTAALIGGGIKLDCYNVDRLRCIYHRFGFIPVAKVILPKDHPLYLYTPERDCEIYYWVFEKDNKFPFIKPQWDESNEKIKICNSTSEAEAYRDSLILKYYGKIA